MRVQMIKKIFLTILLLSPSQIYAADTKISDMTADSSPAVTYKLPILNSTPDNRNTTIGQVLGTMSGDVTSTSAGSTSIGSDKITEGMLKSVDAPADEECLSYESTVGDFEWQACGSGGGASSLTGLSDVGSAAITSANLLIADGTKYQSVSMSGDATITASGATSVTGGSDGLTIGDGSVVGEIDLNELGSNGSSKTGFKSPSSLSADVVYTLPSADGSSGQVLKTDGSKTLSWVAQSSGSGASALTGLSDVSTNYTSGRMLLASGSSYIGTAMSGDLTITSGGVTAIGSGKVGATQIASTTVTAGTFNAGDFTVDTDGRITNAARGQLTSLSDVATSTKTAGNLLVANGTSFASVAMGGDCTINSAGSVTCGASSGGFTDGGQVIRMTTSTDDVAVGASSITGASFAVSTVANNTFVGGNLGIGSTAAPSGSLDVGANKFVVTSAGSISRITNTGSSLTSSNLTFTVTPTTVGSSNSTSGATMIYKGSAATNGSAEIKSTSGVGSGDFIKFTGGSNGATEIARMLGTGFVGIGTTGPTAPLEILAAGATSLTANSDVYTATKFLCGSTTSCGSTVQSAANTACNTTCINGCLIGFDVGTLGAALPNIVNCTDASADECVCMGPN